MCWRSSAFWDRGAVAPQIVAALLSGFSNIAATTSAGVATLGRGRPGDARRARLEGKLKNLEAKLERARRSAAGSASATPDGRRMASRPSGTRTRTRATASRSFTTGSSRISSRCATNSPPRAIASPPRPIPGSRGVPRDRRDGRGQAAGRGGACGAEAHARAAFALVYLFDGEEDLLVGARRGAPLAVGYGEGEAAGEGCTWAPTRWRSPRSPTASPIYEEGDWVTVTREGAEIPGHVGGQPVKRRVIRSPAGGLLAEKGAITATSWPRRSTNSPKSSATRSPITSTWPPSASSPSLMAGRRRRPDARFDRRLRHRPTWPG